jgi:hypothetical protein
MFGQRLRTVDEGPGPRTVRYEDGNSDEEEGEDEYLDASDELPEGAWDEGDELPGISSQVCTYATLRSLPAWILLTLRLDCDGWLKQVVNFVVPLL